MVRVATKIHNTPNLFMTSHLGHHKWNFSGILICIFNGPWEVIEKLGGVCEFLL